MMMSSSFPNCKSSRDIGSGLQEIQSKKKALLALESALKKRISEFKELCLKEGELTGHLPIDYPLQPREPLPQVRRRINISNNDDNLTDTNSIASISSIRLRQSRIGSAKPHESLSTNQDTNLAFPTRPTSTNSTSSSISTASSNTKSTNNAVPSGFTPNQFLQSSSNQSSINSNQHYFSRDKNCNDASAKLNHIFPHHNLAVVPDRFKKPFNMPTVTTFDHDFLNHMRACSTASSSSSSGSAASSTMSASTVPDFKISNGFNANLHTRSCSENLTSETAMVLSDKVNPRNKTNHTRQIISQSASPSNNCIPPIRPPRGLAQTQTKINRQVAVDTDMITRNLLENTNRKPTGGGVQKSLDNLPTRPLQSFNMNGLGNFQPYYEETKPFQMSDFFKYSSKHRQKSNDTGLQSKTTRQLQEDVMKNAVKFPPCDDQIQASVKLIEKSSQKLIEATAKAIASNPGIAEKLNNILPNNGDEH